MAFVARSRSEAVGARSLVRGSITAEYNIGQGSDSSFGDTISDHTGQFSRDIQATQAYYHELATRLNLLTGAH